MINTFKEFIEDEKAWDMYVTGRAGTGKTTDVAELIAYCLAADIECVVTAYTHKACGILATKMPEGANIQTLHKFLKKCPTINSDATNKKHVQQNVKTGKSAKTQILFIDEYSMIGEQDLMDIRAEQDPDYDGGPEMKVVWVGDPYQLPPVNDAQAIRPRGNYCVELTEIKRQAKDNPLGEALEQLVSFIEGAKPEPLKGLIRNRDIVQDYVSTEHEDKVILAYTNKRVEELNESIMGRMEPEPGDKLFSPTTQHHYYFKAWEYTPSLITMPFGEPLMLGSKFKTLEYLVKQDIVRFAVVEDDNGEEHTFACLFGHYNYKTHLDNFKAEAAESNRAIEGEFRGYKAAGWSKANPQHPLARRRAKAWRDFLSFNDSAICLDFAHAMTVHKSQGSTYADVFLDTDDIYIAANFSFEQYLKLMYVACSRASNKVVTN